MISICFYAFDIAFSLFIYQIENTNNCTTLLKGGWSLGAQEDRTALYMNLKSQIIYEHYFNYTFRRPLFAVLVNEKSKA